MYGHSQAAPHQSSFGRSSGLEVADEIASERPQLSYASLPPPVDAVRGLPKPAGAVRAQLQLSSIDRAQARAALALSTSSVAMTSFTPPNVV
jgi:hypothetical protein